MYCPSVEPHCYSLQPSHKHTLTLSMLALSLDKCLWHGANRCQANRQTHGNLHNLSSLLHSSTLDFTDARQQPKCDDDIVIHCDVREKKSAWFKVLGRYCINSTPFIVFAEALPVIKRATSWGNICKHSQSMFVPDFQVHQTTEQYKWKTVDYV